MVCNQEKRRFRIDELWYCQLICKSPHAGLSFGDDKRAAEEWGNRQMQRSRSGESSFWRKHLCVGAVAALLALPVSIARADEGGVSFWVPGLYGSLAAVPAQAPGRSVTSIYWHDSVSAGGDVARAREIEIGR